MKLIYTSVVYQVEVKNAWRCTSTFYPWEKLTALNPSVHLLNSPINHYRKRVNWDITVHFRLHKDKGVSTKYNLIYISLDIVVILCYRAHNTCILKTYTVIKTYNMWNQYPISLLLWHTKSTVQKIKVWHRNGRWLEPFFPEPLGWGTSCHLRCDVCAIAIGKYVYYVY
jgi:hypothetical protein